MNDKPEKNIDEILDIMKKRTGTDQQFKSTGEFKSDFFKKVGVEKKKSFIYSPRFYKYTSIAAALVLGGVFLLTFYSTDKVVVVDDIAETGVKVHMKTEAASATARSNEFQHRPLAGAKVKAPAKSRPAVEWKATGRLGSCKPDGAVTGCYAPMAMESDYYRPQVNFNTEEYKHLTENGFTQTRVSPLSTFGADVDTAGYTNIRRFLLNENLMPPVDAARSEEFINYFKYDYPLPQGDAVFNVNFESMDAPWAPERKLLMVGVQAKDIDRSVLPNSNFVFLIDNSGSMYNVFPMVIEAMQTLADQLRETDRVSVVTYGGGVEVLMDGVSGAEKSKIKDVIGKLCATGYTPGGAGIQEAYKLAHKHFIKGGNNRIVLITDGDFNVGVSSESELVKMVEKERQSAIYLSTFGVGYGNYKDSKMKMLANKGNGNYSYLDNVREAKRVMVNEMTGKMFTLAKDVKFQIEFNPARVAAYRLIGYELRKMEARDFNDDQKDSGEVGVGHQVTALYELIMADAPKEVKDKYLGSVDTLKYQSARPNTDAKDILTFKLRYQEPEGSAPSRLMTFDLAELPKATNNINWAAAVTEFSLLLRDSEFKGNADYASLRRRAQQFLGEDRDGKRAEFLTLVNAAENLKK